ncbi:hypothetical protein Gotur_031356 [Gossypium turneri]
MAVATNLLVILGLDGGTTSTVYICMSIMPFSNALLNPFPVLTHAITGYSNHNNVDDILLVHAIVLDVNFLYITDTVARETLDQVMADALSKSEYCEKYVKPEDVVGAKKVKSSDEKLSEDEYATSDDEEITEKIDL